MSKDLKAGDVVNVRGVIRYRNGDGSFDVDFEREHLEADCVEYINAANIEKVPRPPFIPGQIWEGADGERFLIVDTGGIELRYRRSGDSHGLVSFMEREFGPVNLVLDVVKESN